MVKANGLTLGELTGVSAVVFTDGNGSEFVTGRGEMDFCEFRKRYPDGKRCDHAEFDGSGGRWFAVWVEDCFDPPVAIVRCDQESDAEEVFLSNFTWADISEADAADYDDERHNNYLQWTDRRTWADTESICWREVRPVRVEFDSQ